MITPGVFSFFWNCAVRGVKVQKKPKMKSNNCICHVPDLRKSIAYDHDFWCTCVKWWYLRNFFFIVLKFSFSGCYRGKSAKKRPKWKIAITSITRHISGTVKHMIMIFGTLVLNDDTLISPGIFLYFFQIFIFGVNSVVKE